MGIGLLLSRGLLVQTVGAALIAGGTTYYFTHPQRVVADLPPDLAERGQDVNLTAQDGARLHAVWLPSAAGSNGRPADRTIIHHHGFNGSAGLILARKALYARRPVSLFGTHVPAAPASDIPLPHLRLFGADDREPLFAWPLVRAGLARGFNFLLVDARGHGRSGGAWDVTGVRPSADLRAWARWLRDAHDQLWVGLWGHSFGAALGLALAARPAGGGFDAMVLDSPPIRSEGLYSGVLQRPLYLAIQPAMRQLGNRELPRLLADAHVWMPVQLIHGQADRTVPAQQSEQAYALIRDPQRPERSALWIVPDADHLEAFEVAPEEYARRTLDWFDRWL
ncbi:MAG: Alpha/beta hydrolase family protein [Chloroflexi bacterium ADurb.Bin325]|nr:MAG: Alpha/beta hydrolase family protein [Chloroflexi bacterium ADurb.Bin325]